MIELLSKDLVKLIVLFYDNYTLNFFEYASRKTDDTLKTKYYWKRIIVCKQMLFAVMKGPNASFTLCSLFSKLLLSFAYSLPDVK